MWLLQFHVLSIWWTIQIATKQLGRLQYCLSRVYHTTTLFVTNNFMYFSTWRAPVSLGSSTLVRWSYFWNHVHPSMTNFTQLYHKSWRRIFIFMKTKNKFPSMHQKWSRFVTRWNKYFNYCQNIYFILSHSNEQ